MFLLGYDIGSSSVKASLVDAGTGKCVASAFFPKTEAGIIAVRSGWAEQEPEDWWENLKLSTQSVLSESGIAAGDIKAIGISYQMHGLVCVDRQQRVLRPAIIWCDSRAVPYGQKAFETIGEEFCLAHLLNSPGNFTASKLAWIKENEPHIYAQIDKIMLPGDYIAMKLSGEICTTVEGLSEGMLWDFRNDRKADFLMQYYGFDSSLIADIRPTFAEQGLLTGSAARELGLQEGTPITYRAGDQPNNALSLNVFNPGEIASTAGTSGVVYGVNGEISYDPQSRVNTFAHVNHTAANPRLGVLLCINGTGILNSWIKRNVAPEGISYTEMNRLASQVPVGSAGISILPFGNGAERMLSNRTTGCSFHGIDFNMHDKAHLIRAAQEGIVFSFNMVSILWKEWVSLSKRSMPDMPICFSAPFFVRHWPARRELPLNFITQMVLSAQPRVPGWEQASTKTIKRLSRHSTSWKSLNPIRSGNRNMPMHMDVGNNAWPDLCR